MFLDKAAHSRKTRKKVKRVKPYSLMTTIVQARLMALKQKASYKGKTFLKKISLASRSKRKRRMKKARMFPNSKTFDSTIYMVLTLS